jgi:uncharacterized phage-associated protein
MANVSDVANAFLWLDQQDDEGGVSNLKLQKLVYYAQGFFLAIFDRPLFEDRIEAWTHGPVVPALYHKYKNYGRCAIPLDEGFDFDALQKDEADLIDEVHQVSGQFSAWKLREMTTASLRGVTMNYARKQSPRKSFATTLRLGLIETVGAKKRLKGPSAAKGNRISAQEPVNYDASPPLFSLERLQGGDYCLSCLDQQGKAAFADAIFRRRTLTWGEVKKLNKHGLGFEKIPRKILKAGIPSCITDDADHFIAFRFDGMKPMVGYRQRNVFFVLWFDHNFSLYPHD